MNPQSAIRNPQSAIRNPQSRVLIVDDEKSIRRTLGEFLREAGYDVVEAEDAEVALQRLSETAFDVVVSDIILPGVTGVELLRRLQGIAPHVAVVMMTGEPTVETAAESLRAGALDYLFKPITKGAILRTVANAARIKALEDTRRWLEAENQGHRENLERLVTERTEQLRTSEERLRLALDAAHMGTFDWDVPGSRISWSRRHEELWGFEPGEFAGTYEAFASRVHPDDLKGVNDEVARSLAERTTYTREFRVVWPDGSAHWIAGFGEFSLDRAGQPLRMRGVVLEITARKQAEEAQARLAMAVEQAAETIVITDTEGTILYVNPAFEQSSGYSRAEALGKNPRVLKSGKQDAAFYKQMWDTLARGRVWSGHFINKRKDGKLYEEEATISPVRDSAGRVMNYVAVKRDVTHQMELERQLRQSQKMEAVGRLAGGVAHDFNNILMAIIGYSDMVLKELAPDDPLHGYTEQVRQAGERAAGLTRQLLAFSRQQVLQLRVLDLNEVVSNVHKMLRRLIGEDIKLALSLEPTLGCVKADPGQIEQVILNLAVNARDAMPDGGSLVIQTANVEVDETYASAHREAKPGRYVVLAVTDTGCGMSEEVQQHIFEPFFTAKEQGKGTGLGLATVYGIVKQSEGFTELHSVVGQGTSFKIHLPRIDELVGKPSSDKTDAASPRGIETILLVEDEEAVRKLTVTCLRDSGYTVLEAGNGGEAIAIAQRHSGPIHLLVTDMVMPGMNGPEVARRLEELRPGLRVIYMSGYIDTTILHRGALKDDMTFLQKPFSPGVLACRVRETLDRR